MDFDSRTRIEPFVLNYDTPAPFRAMWDDYVDNYPDHVHRPQDIVDALVAAEAPKSYYAEFGIPSSWMTSSRTEKKRGPHAHLMRVGVDSGYSDPSLKNIVDPPRLHYTKRRFALADKPLQ